MSYIFVSKDFTNFNGNPVMSNAKLTDITGESVYTYYKANVNDYTLGLDIEPQQEIWVGIWFMWNGDMGRMNGIIAASETTSVRVDRNSVYINGANAGALARKTGILIPYLFHIKTGNDDGLFEIIENGLTVYSSGEANVLK